MQVFACLRKQIHMFWYITNREKHLLYSSQHQKISKGAFRQVDDREPSFPTDLCSLFHVECHRGTIQSENYIEVPKTDLKVLIRLKASNFKHIPGLHYRNRLVCLLASTLSFTIQPTKSLFQLFFHYPAYTWHMSCI